MASGGVFSLMRSLDTLKAKLGTDIHHLDATLLSGIKHDFEGLLVELQEACVEKPWLWEQNCVVLIDVTSTLYDVVQRCITLNCSLQKELETLKDVNCSTRKGLETLKETTKELEATVNDLKGELKKKEGDQVQLVLEEMASVVDRSIPHLVLNDIIGEDHDLCTINSMEMALQGTHYDIFEDEAQKRRARNCWDHLKGELDWSNEIFVFMKRLKRSRNPVAHPGVDKSTIEAAFERNVVPRAKLEKLWTIYKKLH